MASSDAAVPDHLRHDNAGPALLIVSWILLLASGIFVTLRVYCKFSRHRGLWWDDYVLIASWVAFLVQSILLTYCVSVGYGKHTWDFPPENMSIAIILSMTAGVFHICAAIWSKTSFALTLLRITDSWTKMFIWFIIISMNIAMGMTGLISFVRCSPVRKAWDFSMPHEEGSCWPVSVLIAYNTFSVAYSGAMDVILALLPWKVILFLQMKRKEKIGVAMGMSMGVFAGITTFVKASRVHLIASGDMSEGATQLTLGAAEVGVTIMAASIPPLRVLILERTSRRYYASGDSPSSQIPKTGIQKNTTFVMTETQVSPSQAGRGQDSRSDKSILNDQAQLGAVRSTNTIVAMDDGRDSDSMGYELNNLE